MQEDGGYACAHVDAEPGWCEVADDTPPAALVFAWLGGVAIVLVDGCRGTSIVACWFGLLLAI